MGGFHPLRVKQKLLFKRHFCRGYKQWSVDDGIIARVSADQAWEGRHYYRRMRVHKECFDALVHYKYEDLTSNLENMNQEFLIEKGMLNQKYAYFIKNGQLIRFIYLDYYLEKALKI